MRATPILLVVLLLAGCSAPPPAPPTDEDPFPRHDLAFSGEDALAHVRTQMTGPDGGVQYRIPGTAGHARVAQWIEHEMAGRGLHTRFQSWGATYACKETPLRNVLALQEGATNRTVVLMAHYDTRPVADHDPDPDKRDEPVPGANDGGSGVAVLLELAEVLRGRAPNLTIIYVFTDAEDGGDLPRDLYPCSTGWIMGALRFMSSYERERANVTEAVIVVDMVGDRNLTLMKEENSRKGPGAPLLDYVWATGQRLGYDRIFLDKTTGAITDDHRAFLDPPAVNRFGRALPAIDLIHTDEVGPSVFHETWHTTHDDMDHVSAASLEAVGRTLEHVLLDLDRAPLNATAAGRS